MPVHTTRIADTLFYKQTVLFLCLYFVSHQNALDFSELIDSAYGLCRLLVSVTVNSSETTAN